jgi:DNA-binding PucR family transcriptional regulator
VHPNTVRYRLRKAADVTGYSANESRDAFTLQIALVLGRLADLDGLG